MEWGLRDYGTGDDQLGLEDHPQKYIDHLVEICREIKRVLKPSGSFWLNLGDTYYGSGKGAGGDGSALERYIPAINPIKQSIRTNWLQPKQLLGIPWRVAIALQHDGWILRNDIIWFKPNHMPSSVKDRLTNAYEHVFLFAKNRRYYFDLDAIRVPHKYLKTDSKRKDFKTRKLNYDEKTDQFAKSRIGRPRSDDYHSRGKNPGDMWSIPTRPFKGAHFVVFNPALIEPIIKAGCPDGGIVLDPFCGSGTTCLVAKKLRRRWIGIEMNPEYVEIANKRIDEQSPDPLPIDCFIEEEKIK